MFGDVKSQLDRLSAKSELICADADPSDDQRLLGFYVRVVEKMLGVERCSIFVNDPAANRVWLKCGTGVTERQIEVHRDNSVAGQVIDSGQLVAIENMQEREGAHKNVDQETGFVTRNVLCVPVRSAFRKEMVGAIQALNKIDGQGFSPDDIETLEEISYHLQVTIERTFLSQEIYGYTENLIGYARKAMWSLLGLTTVVVGGFALLLGAMLVAPMLK